MPICLPLDLPLYTQQYKLFYLNEKLGVAKGNCVILKQKHGYYQKLVNILGTGKSLAKMNIFVGNVCDNTWSAIPH